MDDFRSTMFDPRFSDEEEFVEVMTALRRRPRVIRDRSNHFATWRDEEFFHRFRMSKDTVRYVLSLIEQNIKSSTDRNNAVSPELKLLLTIRYYATGNMIRSCSDFCGIDRSTGGRILHEVSHAIASLRPNFIYMPTGREANEVMVDFYDKSRFPRCIGALDCTHVKIQSPGGERPEIFRNRKNVYSINVQTVSDASLHIRNIVARWPGSAHDSTIFANSKLKRMMERQIIPGVLVADGGYAATQYLLKRLAEPRTEGERLYNESLTRSRNVVERSYGVWKRRFPILAKGICVNVSKVEAIIVATAVLHNIAIDRNEAVPEVDEETEGLISNDVFEDEVTEHVGGNGNLTLRYIEYFNHLLHQ